MFNQITIKSMFRNTYVPYVTKVIDVKYVDPKNKKRKKTAFFMKIKYVKNVK